MSQTSPTKVFLVTPLDVEPAVVPENTQIVRADCVETLMKAQAVKEAGLELLNGNRVYAKLRQLLRTK